MVKDHLGQVDYLRVFGLVSIVIIHSLGFFFSIPEFSPINHTIQGLSMNLFRYGRFIFMFVTGLVFFYNYQDKQINLLRFYKRRFNNLVLPYVIWTAFYLYLGSTSGLVSWQSATGFLVLWWQNTLSGNAFYHLYYIVVSIQFYLVFPLLVFLFKPRRKRLWTTVILVSGLCISLGYHYFLEVRGPALLGYVNGTGWESFTMWLLARKNHLLISYFPYYLLGGMTGLYWNESRKWVAENKKWIKVLFALGFIWVGVEYLYVYLHLGLSFDLAASIFRPSMYLYSLATIGAFLLLASAMERRGTLRWLVKILSGNSFGIYLIHPVVLFWLHSFYYWQNIPITMMVPIDALLAVALSCLLSQVLGSSRYTGFMVGSFGNRNFKKIPWELLLKKAKVIGQSKQVRLKQSNSDSFRG